MNRIGIYLMVSVFSIISAISGVNGQIISGNDSSFAAGIPKTGHLWGYAFGDYATKAHSDSLNRGGANQYTGVAKNENAFAFRRIYLGYDYNISKKFFTEILLAAEDNITHTSGDGAKTASGDLLSNNKYTFYIKYANVHWKDIWTGTELIIGQSMTPAFSATSEKVWGYRSVERTIADIRRTPSFDLGVSLRGRFDKAAKYGYDLMVGNGNGAVPENNKFKKFYGDLWAKLLNKKLTLQLYADYERLQWTSQWHHETNMIKAFVGYTDKAYAVGVEGFLNHGKNDVAGINASNRDTLNADALGLSIFGRATVIPGKLAAFSRIDFFNPDRHYEADKYESYQGFSSHYEPNTKEKFVTAGLDFTPVSNVHIIPNIWYNSYEGQQAGLVGARKHDYDLVYRVSFNYVFGK
ncbi:hypothetical protein [Arachidicoccus ginsenosidivorans]|jgi:hypothetical protein